MHNILPADKEQQCRKTGGGQPPVPLPRAVLLVNEIVGENDMPNSACSDASHHDPEETVAASTFTATKRQKTGFSTPKSMSLPADPDCKVLFSSSKRIDPIVACRQKESDLLVQKL